VWATANYDFHKQSVPFLSVVPDSGIENRRQQWQSSSYSISISQGHAENIRPKNHRRQRQLPNGPGSAIYR